MCEPAQAGCRNHHKTTDEMQGITLFLFPREWGDPRTSTWAEAHKRGRRHCRAWSFLEDRQTCWFCLFVRDSHRRSLPLCFDLSHSRAGIPSMFHRVPLSLSITGLCYLNTEFQLVKHTRIDSNYYDICVFLLPSCKSLERVYNPPRQSSVTFLNRLNLFLIGLENSISTR